MRIVREVGYDDFSLGEIDSVYKIEHFLPNGSSKMFKLRGV